MNRKNVYWVVALLFILIAIYPNGTNSTVTALSISGAELNEPFYQKVLNGVGEVLTSQVDSTFSVGNHPGEVVFSADGTIAYVMNFSEPVINVVRTLDNTVIGNIVVSTTNPEENLHYSDITPDGQYLYVPFRGANSVVPIRLSDNSVQTSIPVSPHPMSVKISGDGRKAYVGTWAGLDVIDLLTNTVINHLDVGGSNVIYDLVLSEAGDKLYLARSSYASGAVIIVNPSDLSIQNTITFDEDLGTQIALSPDGNWVWVTRSMSGYAEAIRLSDNQIFETPRLESGLVGIGFSPDGSQAYITSWNSNHVFVVNAQDRSLIQILNVGTHPVRVVRVLNNW
jgi:YVTN family beta-propeller protein